MITTTNFFIVVAIACAAVCLFLGWIAWPVKPRKVDTQKRDKEIDDLLNFDITDKIYD